MKTLHGFKQDEQQATGTDTGGTGAGTGEVKQDQGNQGGAPVTPPADVGPKKTRFFFKKKKDEKGNVIPAPEALELVIPELTAEDVTNIILGGDEKQVSLLLEAVNDVVLKQARSIVDDDVEKVRKEGIPADQLSWDTISKIPPATRRGGGIDEETWNNFKKDYVEVMVHHGKTKEKAEAGAELLVKRFAPVRDNKKVIQALRDNVLVWFNNTSQKEDLSAVYEALTSRADTLLAKDEEAILQAI